MSTRHTLWNRFVSIFDWLEGRDGWTESQNLLVITHMQSGISLFLLYSSIWCGQVYNHIAHIVSNFRWCIIYVLGILMCLLLMHVINWYCNTNDTSSFDLDPHSSFHCIRFSPRCTIFAIMTFHSYSLFIMALL